MRVLQVIDSLYWGGVQELQVTLATAAQKSEVSLSLASLGADEDTPYRARLERLGVPVLTFPARKLYDWKRILALASFMRCESFDLVHTHLRSSNIAGAFAARLAGIPVVATLHLPNMDSNPLRKWLNVWVLRSLMHSVIAVGPVVAETFFNGLGRKPIRVIPNAVCLPPEFSAEERMKLRLEVTGSSNGPVIISTGRLNQVKGYEDLLNAIAHLRRAYPSLRLLIAGAGRLYPVLQEQIQSQDLTAHVLLLGGRRDVPGLLAASDIYASASYLEGMSISILEAMAAGLPVVATCAGENSMFVLPSTGILIPFGDAQALAAALARLIESPELRTSLGVEGRSLVSRLYNVETWFDRIRGVYEEALESHR